MMPMESHSEPGASIPANPAPDRPRILVVEDEPSLRGMLMENLEAEGFEAEGADDGTPAILQHQARPADLIVLDLMLPRMDGFQVLRYLREGGDEVPVLMLTARAEEQDRLQGLGYGADDYLTKPFSILELIARIRTILRRVRPAPARCPYLRTGPFRLDMTKRSLRRGHNEIQLSHREFRLLEVLLAKPGKIHSRQELVNLAWEPDGRPGTRTVDVHIAGLRKKLGDDEKRPFIATIEGVGYAWMREVRESQPG